MHLLKFTLHPQSSPFSFSSFNYIFIFSLLPEVKESSAHALLWFVFGKDLKNSSSAKPHMRIAVPQPCALPSWLSITRSDLCRKSIKCPLCILHMNLEALGYLRLTAHSMCWKHYWHPRVAHQSYYYACFVWACHWLCGLQLLFHSAIPCMIVCFLLLLQLLSHWHLLSSYKIVYMQFLQLQLVLLQVIYRVLLIWRLEERVFWSNCMIY